MRYPKITFKREEPASWQKTRYGVYHDGEYLGSVYTTPLGGWKQVDNPGGYATRYEAAYSLYTIR